MAPVESFAGGMCGRLQRAKSNSSAKELRFRGLTRVGESSGVPVGRVFAGGEMGIFFFRTMILNFSRGEILE